MKTIIVKAILLVCTVFTFGISSAWALENSEVVIELGDIGFDMELDSLRQQLYVSVPTRNEVVIISTQSYEIIDRVIVGSRPHGIDLSLDGTLLFAALNGAGAVAYLDMESMGVTEVVVGAELGDSRAYDVVEAKSNRVFVSANPGSSGFAYIVMIKRDQSDNAVRVADNRIIRAGPIFEESPDYQFLYVGEGFSPNSLYKLDISTDSAPIVLENQHGSVSGTDHLDVNSDGSRIYLGSGQVLRTGSFIQAGLIGSGVPKLNNDGSLAFVGKEPNIIEIYDTSTFLKLDEFTTSCSFSQIQRIEVLPDESGWLILGDDIVCVVSQQPFKRLNISPPSGDYVTTQGFDLTLIVEAPGLSVTGGSATLDGSDVTGALVSCVIPGTLISGGQTFRCPGLTGGTFGTGTHTLDVTLDLSDGSSVNDGVTWEVKENVEP